MYFLQIIRPEHCYQGEQGAYLHQVPREPDSADKVGQKI